MISLHRRIGLVVLGVVLPLNAMTPQPVVMADSMPPVERIDAAIAFLEDSQQVAATIERLKLLADSHRALHDSGEGTPVAVYRAEMIDIFKAGRELYERGARYCTDLVAELRNLGRQVNAVSDVLQTGEPRGRILTLLLFAVAAMIIGLLVGIVLWRLGRRLLRDSMAGDGSPRRGNGIFGTAITRSAFGIGGSAALFITGWMTSGTVLQRFFLAAAQGYTAYLAVATLLTTLFSPQRSRLRSIPCPDAAAIQITRRCSRLFRTVLLLYLLYSAADALTLPNSRILIANLFQVLMTVMIPLTAFRLRKWYLDPFRRFRDAAAKHRRLHSIAYTLLSRLPLVLLLYLIVLTGISMFGPAATYRFFIRGSIQTTVAAAAGAILIGGWRVAMNYLGSAQRRVLAQFSDLQDRISGNLRVVTVTGYLGICGGLLFLLIRVWEFRLSDLLSSQVPVVQVSLRIAAVIVGAWLAVQAAYFIIGRFSEAAQKRMLRADGANPVEIGKRVSTLSGIFQKIISVSVVVIGVIMVMDELGFDIKAMVAGVGIVGLAVGFGAQNLVRDVISGLFVIFENRIRVGDVAIINGTGGLVEQVNLRTSVLRSLDGTVHVFPNGEITSLSNMTHEFSYYVFDLGIAYKEDTDRVSAILKQIGEEIGSDPEYRDAILEPLEILGVDAFADSAVIIKARIKTIPIKQWFVGREMNRRIKKRFDELGIEIPFPHQTLYFGEASKPFSITADMSAAPRNELKKIIREVLEERQGR